MKTCPKCAEALQPAAVICRQCGSEVSPREPARSWGLALALAVLALAAWAAAPADVGGRARAASGGVLAAADERCPEPGAAVLPPGHPPIERELPPGHPPLSNAPRLPPGHPPIDGAPALPLGKVPVTPIPNARPFVPEGSTVAL